MTYRARCEARKERTNRWRLDMHDRFPTTRALSPGHNMQEARFYAASHRQMLKFAEKDRGPMWGWLEADWELLTPWEEGPSREKRKSDKATADHVRGVLLDAAERYRSNGTLTK